MKYKVFPKDYDPMIASGPCSKDLEKMGISWTPADTKKMKKLEKQAKIQDHKPENGICYQEID